MDRRLTIILVVVGIVIITALVLYGKDLWKMIGFGSAKSGFTPSSEGFSYVAGQVGSLDSLDAYERLDAPEYTGYGEREYTYPKTSSDLIPYNIDVADPATHLFSALGPRVIIKNRQKDYHLASHIRGDIPIKYYPDTPLVGHSRFGRDSLVVGYYSPEYKATYDYHSNYPYKNMPMYVSNEETIMDYTP